MTSIRHMLWFDSQAEDAAQHYIRVLGDGRINNVSHGPGGEVFTVDFEILNQKYIALNGGPQFSHSEAFSIFLDCDGQEEVDRFWEAFINAGGTASQCGWLKDKFGVSWQIIPKQLGECLGNPDPEKAGRALEAMMGMQKIIVADLESAVAQH
jgi:predicted 3-demethylubiquinone-9 3-methyltransferase (glyoxalase superfamily)